jgi:glycosyltransferase involved in cell wall biosynthesis
LTPHILIVTAGPLCRNPRALKEAFTLGSAGYDVTVANVAGHPRFEAFDQTLLAGAPFQRVSVSHNTTAGALQIRKTLNRIHTWLARRGAPYGFQSAHAFGPAAALTQLTLNHPADLTIVHTEIGMAVGNALLKTNRSVATDIEDWHSEDLRPEDRRHRPVKLLRNLERHLINRSAYTSTTSNALADSLQMRYGGQKPAVITNSFPLQPAPSRLLSSQPPQLFWFSQTIGPGRGLKLFLSAWALTKHPSQLVLLGEPCDGYKEHLCNSLPASHRERLQFAPLVSPSELPSVIANHDVGLALEQSSIVNRDLTITNKILQYLNAGLAVFASETAGHREVLQDAPDAGILVDAGDTVQFAGTIDNLLSNPDALRKCQQAARKLAEDKYCWEKEAPKLLALVEHALK